MLIANYNCAFSNGMSSTGCPSTCKLANNCLCPSLTNPAGYNLSDLPQFVTFTWDDAVENDVNVNWFPANNFWNGSILDSIGCRPRPTFYVTSTSTHYGFVNLLSKLGLVCDHSVNHYTNRSSTLANFTYETSQSRDWIQGYSKMAYPVKCARAPFLETSDTYFQSLVNTGITLDSSIMATAQGNGTRFWPYTMDYGIQESDVCSDLQCPSKGFNGLWQIPMQHQYTRSNGVITDVWTDLMDPNVTTANYATTLARFKYNFAENYAMSRVPMGLYIHYFWFQKNSNLWSFVASNLDTTKVQFVNDYYNYIKTFSQVIFVTEAMIVQWIKNPQTFSQIVADKANNASSIWKCPDYTVNINNTCPSNYPLTSCTNSTDGSTFLSCGCTQVNYTSSCSAVANCQTQNQTSCLCTTCNAGYQVSSGSCSACSVSQCSAYSSGCTCSTCNAGYSLSANTCNACSVSQCSTYSSGCTCSACSTGYKVVSGGCQTCGVSQCSAYSSGCTCSSCSTGYQVVSGACSACTVSQCTAYSSGCTCSSCNTGYQVVSGSCSACSVSQCSAYSSGCTCSSCNVGYQLVSGSCSACSVSQCSAYSSGCTCSACNSGYQLSAGSCQACSVASCSAYNSVCGCTGCQAGYSLNNGACCAIVSSCSGYNSTCGCSSCASGTTLSNGKCCAAVTNCNSYDASTCACSSCSSPYSLVGNACTCPSVSNCNSFVSGTCTCSGCSAGYLLATSTNTCNACGLSGCSSYSSGCSCSSCSSGLTLSVSNNLCCATVSSCSAYSSTCACSACSTGFSLSGNQCCASVASCASYDSSCGCASCNSPYSLSAGACSCPAISNCNSYNSATCACTACAAGYQVSSNTCASCSVASCSSYSSGCTCSGCSTGFTLANNLCCSAVANCNAYSTSCACTACSSGFTLSAGVCQQQTGGCSNSLCTGFYSNCSCSSCVTGYNLLSNLTCVATSKTANIAGCYSYLYTNTSKCSACYPGYTLTSAKTSCGTWKNVYAFNHSYDGFCGANSTDSNDVWLYANCQQCYQVVQSANCTAVHGSVAAMVYSEMNCGDWNTICVRKGYCKPISSNWVQSCSTCLSCSEGDTTCPSGYVCSRDSGCMDATQKCSSHL